jgi:hypothetical protein
MKKNSETSGFKVKYGRIREYMSRTPSSEVARKIPLFSHMDKRIVETKSTDETNKMLKRHRTLYLTRKWISTGWTSISLPEDICTVMWGKVPDSWIVVQEFRYISSFAKTEKHAKRSKMRG